MKTIMIYLSNSANDVKRAQNVDKVTIMCPAF